MLVDLDNVRIDSTFSLVQKTKEDPPCCTADRIRKWSLLIITQAGERIITLTGQQQLEELVHKSALSFLKIEQKCVFF